MAKKQSTFAAWEWCVVEGLVCSSLQTSITRRDAIALVNEMACHFMVSPPLLGRSWPSRFRGRVGGFYDHKSNTIYAHQEMRLTLTYLHEFTHALLYRGNRNYTGAHHAEFVLAYIHVIGRVMPDAKESLLKSAWYWGLLQDGMAGDQDAKSGQRRNCWESGRLL